MGPRRRLLFLGFVTFALAACASKSPDRPAPVPTVQVDDATCAAQLETLAVIEGNPLWMAGLAAAPDGTLYFVRSGTELDGVFALDPGGTAPRRLTPADAFVSGQQIWVEGDNVLLHDYGKLQSVPRAGGPATLVTRVASDTDFETLATAAALDATDLYVGLSRFAADGEHQEMWRAPRDGSPPQLLYSGLTAETPGFWNASLVLDGDSIYIGATSTPDDGYGGLFRMPKAGGPPTKLRRAAFGIDGTIARVGADLYSTPFYGNLTRFPLDPTLAPTVISGVGGAFRLAFDESAAYAAFFHDVPDAAHHVIHSRLTFARVPSGVETVTRTACTEARDFPPNLGWAPLAMALDASYLYALLRDADASNSDGRFEIVRMRR
jgi:hypothetical protein